MSDRTYGQVEPEVMLPPIETGSITLVGAQRDFLFATGSTLIARCIAGEIPEDSLVLFFTQCRIFFGPETAEDLRQHMLTEIANSPIAPDRAEALSQSINQASDQTNQ